VAIDRHCLAEGRHPSAALKTAQIASPRPVFHSFSTGGAGKTRRRINEASDRLGKPLFA
jgi:hypothetical protein